MVQICLAAQVQQLAFTILFTVPFYLLAFLGVVCHIATIVFLAIYHHHEGIRLPKTMTLNHVHDFKYPASDQDQSAFFTTLPAEIRDIIYEYVFTEYEDLDDPYDFNTCYRRPGYFGPRRSHTALLQTCQQIYSDCWYMPWTLSRQTFYLAWSGRRPEKVNNPYRLSTALAYINNVHPDAAPRRKQIGSVQVFAQLCNLESGNDLSGILDTPYFYPRSITVTVRHTDIWGWEGDAPIAMYGSNWVWSCRFPSSVTNLTFELESLNCKRDQVDDIMTQIQRGWYFTRKDGVKLGPDPAGHTIEKWMGSSTWEGRRWRRDEEPGEERKIKYYLASLRFVPVDMEDLDRLDEMEKNAKRTGVVLTRPYSRVNEDGTPWAQEAEQYLDDMDPEYDDDEEREEDNDDDDGGEDNDDDEDYLESSDDDDDDDM